MTADELYGLAHELIACRASLDRIAASLSSGARNEGAPAETIVEHYKRGHQAMTDRYQKAHADCQAMIAENDALERSCPCTHVTPCHDRCSCVMPISSSGCRRCCKYGSTEQQRTAASRIAGAISVYEAALAWEVDKGTESSWNRPNGSDEHLRRTVREAVATQREGNK